MPEFDSTLGPAHVPRLTRRKAPPARLLLMVLVSNHLAATPADSMPYLPVSEPLRLRLQDGPTAFQFVPLAPAAGPLPPEPEVEASGEAADAPPEPEPPAIPPPVRIEPAPAADPPATANGSPAPTAPAGTGAPATSPQAPPPPTVRLEDLLPYFPTSSAPQSRASFRQS